VPSRPAAAQHLRDLAWLRRVRDRIERAMALLRCGDVSVTEACLAVGCSSLGTFSSRFTELSGCRSVSIGTRRRGCPPAWRNS